MIPEKLSKNWILEDRPVLCEVTPELLDQMRSFCYKKWCERAAERGVGKPDDLSYSCKFTSMFVREVIGGYISGSYDHQFVVLDDEVIDINQDAQDVRDLDDPHDEDFSFLGRRDHLESLESCVPRVNDWVSEFKLSLENKASFSC